MIWMIQFKGLSKSVILQWYKIFDFFRRRKHGKTSGHRKETKYLSIQAAFNWHQIKLKGYENSCHVFNEEKIKSAST